MAKRKEKVIISPIKPDLKARFEKLIHSSKKDTLEAKYRNIASKSIFKTDEDLRYTPIN